MLIGKLNGSVYPSALLGDVELDVELLLHHIITGNMISFNSTLPSHSQIWLKATHFQGLSNIIDKNLHNFQSRKLRNSMYNPVPIYYGAF